MKLFSVTLLIILVNMFSCNTNSHNKILNEHLNKFDKNFTSHFPREIHSNNYDVITHESVRKNDIGIYLYEYDAKLERIDSLLNYYNDNSVKMYTNSSDCLLIVNRFENIKTYEETDNIVLDYETRNKQNKSCYRDEYPIPNFIDYRFLNENSNTFLGKDFNIYVLESGKKQFIKYDLIPNPQMPEIWSNGFSKGVSISKKQNIVIFWSILW